ncbi:putative lysine-specific demethylase JMJ16 [Citrus sinensis]|uniref:putative lysine-specific demethylase JMJ16 n=1 Tax=Citrus sinensis TaxID=2711 RepID=UPI00219989C0|nr:putative lysine-specific demethylase JMJ16 [Citrus sinensis]XP_024954237.2 putative lysine-specific demethylase JMJ16 [Citrus sinensis]XP_052292883.1 putative lysine-specific demethylase JMJ16 [Citrus sinensis]KAH9729329.1 putative lysine-specific demethylase JMJ16 [Citrus sinensis]
MGTKRMRANLGNEDLDKLSAPPGFMSLTSFLLKKVENSEESCNSVAFASASAQEPVCANAPSDMVDAGTLKRSLRNRPWILYEQSDNNQKESNFEQPVEELSSRATLPKGVIRGCPDCSNCLKVTARWSPEGAKNDVLEEAPVFYPTEEEFSDTLKYIASVRLKSEEYGICRIVPPPSWKPPCLVKENDIWKSSKFVTQIQQIDGLQNQYFSSKAAKIYDNVNSNSKRRRSLNTGLQNGVGGNGCTMNLDEARCTEGFESERGPEFTLETFKKYADDFKEQYFCTKNIDMTVDENPLVFKKQGEPSLENIEGEYRRIIENPTEEIEVLYGENLETGTFGSGFPTVSNPCEASDHQKYLKSGWNLNNLPMLPGSLLSSESCKTCNLLVPRLHVGMCFTSIYWKVEEHCLCSLYYMHLGAPKIWHSIPQRYAVKFDATAKKYLPTLSFKQSKWHNRWVASLSPSPLKSEGVPVYRCTQSPGEFVLVFSGSYYSGFDCGFNCSESVNFAPIEWLPHGQNAIELYREQGRKTSISHDKLLLGAAREVVKTQWEISLVKKHTSDNFMWRHVSGKDGILAKALKSRINSESNRRKYLCSSSQSQRMDKNFDYTSKRECNICLYDLHLSAAFCPCSPDIYSCLNHVKQLCSCAWTEKIFLFRYEISELNVLLEAVEGKLSAVYRWAKDDLKMYLHSYSSRDGLRPNSQAEESKQTEYKPLDSAKFNGVGSDSFSSIKAKMNARLLQAKSSNGGVKAKDETRSTVVSSATAQNSSFLNKEITIEVSSDSLSVSSSSESE